MLKLIKHKPETELNYSHGRPVEEFDTQPPTRAQISLFMAELGRKGGKKGGKRRMETMTAEERSAVAREAALTRWKKPRKRSSQTKG